MDDSELLQRAIGVLTEAGEYKRLLLEDPDRDDIGNEGTTDNLLRDVLRLELNVPENASLQDIGALVSEELGPVVYRLISAFAVAFHELAEEHDRHDPAVPSSEVLRRLALKAEGM